MELVPGAAYLIIFPVLKKKAGFFMEKFGHKLSICLPIEKKTILYE